jgi:hypothetical protein
MGEETARQRVVNVGTGETHLNPNTEKTLHDEVYLFPTD